MHSLTLTQPLFSKKILVLLPCLLINFILVAQMQADTLRITRGPFCMYQGKTKLKVSKALSIVSSNPEAAEYMRKAKSSYDIGNVLGFAGGFMIGLPIGSALGNNDPNWTLAAIGGGIILTTIPIHAAYRRNAAYAVRRYNAGMSTSASDDPGDEFQLFIAANGIQLRF